MQYTNHYNLNLPEGSDIVNPLVQDNPNYTIIDGALYANKVRTVGKASEVKSGTVHAITRSDSDIDVMIFTATGDWITGDSMTVDGTPVSVYLVDGTAPLTGAYVINTEVMAAISGSRVTLYTGAGAVTSLDADDVVYDNTVSGLSATDAQAAIDECAGDIAANTSDIVTVKARQDANSAGSSVALAAYTSLAGAFVCPNDGYVSVLCGSAASTAALKIVGANDLDLATLRVSGIAFLADACFVKKGMKVYASVNTGSGNYYSYTAVE